MNKPKTDKYLLICDTNIVIKMNLFKHSMFEEVYSFGEVETHEIIIGEIARWIKNPKSRKHKKFGKEMLEKARDLSLGCMGNLKDLAPEELRKRLQQYSSIEKKNPHQGPGKETSKEDKQIFYLIREIQAT